MRIYHYEETTNAYMGSSQAMEDPMEPGRWLIPAWATTVEPGAEIEGMEQVFNGTEWVYRDVQEEGGGA